MRPWLYDLLRCPSCKTRTPLSIAAESEHDGEVVTGLLTCPDCLTKYPIRHGIPRFVAPDQDYCGNFGFQWQKWKDIQIDRLSGHHLSETRFFADTGWDKGWLKGKIVLDGGCGAGRFADVALSHGARVVAMDLSDAIDACRLNTEIHGERAGLVQGSLLDLPFRDGVFDAVYCMGVIQHTPDPKAVMTALPAHVKAGGRVMYNFYEEGLWRRLQVFKYGLRLITPNLPISITLGLSKFLVGAFYWLTRSLAKIPKIRILNHIIPIAAVHDPALTPEQQYAWTVLDTFDWYGARFEKRQHHQQVRALLEGLGLEDVSSAPGIARGIKPGESQ
ncbi:MAG: methyltransferase domain-containing protein [Rhodospirillales bacterium]|nr:methyltransferase domain-containing protein [Rhodospirillales bacterium]